MPSNNVSSWLAARPEIQSIFACVCDLNGTLRGKRLPIDQAEKVTTGGMRLPLSVTSVDIWGEDIRGSKLVFETGDSDGLCDFTGRDLVPITWTSQPIAMAMLWMRNEDGTPFTADPRRALASVVDRFKARGLTPVVAIELEFYLFDPSGDKPQAPRSPITGKRLDSDEVLSLDELEHFDSFLNDVYDASAQQGISVDAAISENGAGQFEINMMHTDDPLKAADDTVLFKRLVRGIARKHGFGASFMAKPFGDRAGNGMHVHFSLLNEQGENVFDNGAEEGAPVMLNAVAGLLATMRENSLTFAPHANSYRRLLPGTHAPTGICWGYENRTAAIRIPGGNHKARRIEHRVAGADANPYLVLSSILGGALIGIEQQLTPVAAIVGDAYSHDLAQLPVDWSSAVEAFQRGEHVTNIFSEQLQTLFVQCKTQELEGFARQVTDFEYRSYLEVV